MVQAIRFWAWVIRNWNVMIVPKFYVMNYGNFIILILHIGDMIVVGTNDGGVAHWKPVFSNNLTWMVCGLLIRHSGCKYSEIENSE